MRNRIKSKVQQETKTTNLSQFVSNLFSTVISNVQTSMLKLQGKIEKDSKITVFTIKNRVRNSQQPLKSIQKIQQPIQPNLNMQQHLRLKEIDRRKLQLIQRLRRIQSEIQSQNSLSRIARSKISLKSSQLRIKQSVSVPQKQKHNKVLNFLSKLHEQKSERQQRQAERIKKKQQLQLQKIKDTQSNTNEQVISKYSNFSKHTVHSHTKIIDSLDREQHKMLSQFKPQEQIQ